MELADESKKTAFWYPPDYFRLVAVFLVTCVPLLVQFTQVVFIELNVHKASFLRVQRYFPFFIFANYRILMFVNLKKRTVNLSFG